jgi:hypothetical protein
MSRNALPAAVLVSIGCSVARRLAPSALRARNDVLEVTDRAGEPVDACHDQGVACTDEFEDGGELGSAGRRGAAHLLGPDDLAPGGLKGLMLKR